jgi:hypothetical protein
MERLNEILDNNPGRVGDMVKDANLNRIAHVELQAYNDTGQFLYKHPILSRYNLKNELEQLRKACPDKFMEELINASKNITRYESQIRTNKYSDPEELASWQETIVHYKDKLDLMKQLISQ